MKTFVFLLVTLQALSPTLNLPLKDTSEVAELEPPHDGVHDHEDPVRDGKSDWTFTFNPGPISISDHSFAGEYENLSVGHYANVENIEGDQITENEKNVENVETIGGDKITETNENVGNVNNVNNVENVETASEVSVADFTGSLKKCHTTRKSVVPLAQREAMRDLDVAGVKTDIEELLTNSQEYWPADYGNYGPFLIRLAWHSAGSYRSSDGRGGGDGARMRFDPEQSWEDNTNLDKARKLLGPIKEKYWLGLSWGDLFILAGNVAIESMGGPILGFCGGRIDDNDGTESTLLGPTVEQEEQFPCPEEGDCKSPLGTGQMQLIYVNPGGPKGIPDPLKSSGNIREVFGRMGMNDSETVALIGGGHAFGKNHGACDCGAKPMHLLPINRNQAICGTGKGPDTYTSGFEFPWTTKPTKWDNEYFQNLVSYDHEKGKGAGGKVEWKSRDEIKQADTVDGKGKQDIAMLTSDVALKYDAKYLELIKEFAENEVSLKHAFKHAWYKLTTRDMGPRSRCLGNNVPPAQPFQYPLPEPAENLDFYSVKAEIEKLVKSEGDYCASLLIRLSWQCSATYRATDYVGGCNGARIRFLPQLGWPVNEGLQPALDKLKVIKDQFGDRLSWADLIILAGNVAVEMIGGLPMEFCPGRTDASEDDGLSDILDKDASVVHTFNQLCSLVDHMNLTNEEFSVLYAAGLFARIGNDKIDGSLSNIFFKRILETETQDMTEMDLMFKYNEDLKNIAETYAKDNQLFVKHVAAAWTKVSNLGSFDGPFESMCDTKGIFQ